MGWWRGCHELYGFGLILECVVLGQRITFFFSDAWCLVRETRGWRRRS